MAGRCTPTTARLVIAAVTIGDLAFFAALVRRWRIVRPVVGPEDEDLATWTAGVVGTYTLVQTVVAARPTPWAARTFAVLRAVLIGGDVAIAVRGRKVGRLGWPTAVLNAALAGVGWWAAGAAGTTEERPVGAGPAAGPVR